MRKTMYRMTCLPGLTITVLNDGTLKFEYDGVIFIAGHIYAEEAIEEAVFFFTVHEKIKQQNAGKII